VWSEKKVISRNMSKSFIQFLKRDTLKQLVDVGVLRRAQDYSFGTHFVP